MNEKIRLLLIYEILGRPPEHIVESLTSLIKSIGENSGITIIKNKIHEPHPINETANEKSVNSPNLFSTFAEVEMEVDNLSIVFQIVMNTLPSSIDIISPSEMTLKNFDLNNLLSDLILKLHKYDEVAKTILLEREKFNDELRKRGNKNL